jgi:amino acid transporter
MKSVVGTIIIFIGLYILMMTGVFNFLAQDFIFPVIMGVIIALLIVAVFVLGVPKKIKKGEHHDKDTNLD